jgi:hypothetical protein
MIGPDPQILTAHIRDLVLSGDLFVGPYPKHQRIGQTALKTLCCHSFLPLNLVADRIELAAGDEIQATQYRIQLLE